MRIHQLGALFLFLGVGCGQAVGGSPPGNAEIEVGECEGNAGYRSASDDTGGMSGEGEVWVEAADRRIVVHLDDMSANCCPSPSATFETVGSVVSLDFVGVFSETSCDCACITDFVVTSDPFAAGEYSVEVDYDGVSQGTFPVTIP